MLYTIIMGNSVHCLILHITMNNIDMPQIGRGIELSSSIVYIIVNKKMPYFHWTSGNVYKVEPIYLYVI